MTTTKLIDRSRTVVGMYGTATGGSALHLALAIMLASGLKTSADIANAFRDTEGGEVIVNPLAPALPIEGVDMYPDSIAVLDDGSLLICDALANLIIGDAYRDQVHPAAEQPAEPAAEAPSVEEVADATGKSPAEVEPGDVEAVEAA